VFRVLIDPENEDLHHFAPVRTSFCAEPEWLPFQIGPRSAPAGQGLIAWGPPAEVPPESAVPPSPARERGALRRSVMEWLRTMLLKSDMLCTAVMREAKQLGFSESTVRRAREDLKVRMYRDEGGPCSSGWWTLRPQSNAPDRPPDWIPDDAALVGIQNWEGVPAEGLSLPDDIPGTPDEPGRPDVQTAPDLSPGSEMNGRKGRRNARLPGNGRESQARPDQNGEATARLATIPDILWERVRGPLVAAILGAAPEGGASMTELPGNGHSASIENLESDGRRSANKAGRPSNGKRRKPKPK
jgi:hypothetical protein